MIRWLGILFETGRSCLRTHRELALENLALRQQLAVWKARQPRPRFASLPHGQLLPKRQVLEREVAVRAKTASQCPNEDSEPSDHDREIADQSAECKFIAQDDFLEGTPGALPSATAGLTDTPLFEAESIPG